MTCWKEISVWYWNEFYRKSQLNYHQTCYRMLEMYGISNAHNWLFTHIGSRPRSHIRWYVYYVPQFFPLNNSIFPLIEYHSFNCFFHSARYFFSFCIAKLFYHTLLKIKEKISWRRHIIRATTCQLDNSIVERDVRMNVNSTELFVYFMWF